MRDVAKQSACCVMQVLSIDPCWVSRTRSVLARLVKLGESHILTKEKRGHRALELEQVPDDGSAASWSCGSSIHSGDVGEAFAVLGINGVPHQAWSPKQSVLCPAEDVHWFVSLTLSVLHAELSCTML